MYGVVGMEIHTDHQPLAYSISDKNPNIDMKSWYSFIQSFTPKIQYQPVNNLSDADISEDSSDENSIHSAESSFENVIEETNKPLNQFKNQLLITTGRLTVHESINVFNNVRHIIKYDTQENLVTLLKEYISPNISIGLHCTLEDLYLLP